MNTSRRSALNPASPSAVEFEISQLEKSRPEPASEEMTAWLSQYNQLLSKLHRSRQ